LRKSERIILTYNPESFLTPKHRENHECGTIFPRTSSRTISREKTLPNARQ